MDELRGDGTITDKFLIHDVAVRYNELTRGLLTYYF